MLCYNVLCDFAFSDYKRKLPMNKKLKISLFIMPLQNVARSDMGLNVVELKATEDGYPLYRLLGFHDETSKYYQMSWSN